MKKRDRIAKKRWKQSIREAKRWHERWVRTGKVDAAFRRFAEQNRRIAPFVTGENGILNALRGLELDDFCGDLITLPISFSDR